MKEEAGKQTGKPRKVKKEGLYKQIWRRKQGNKMSRRRKVKKGGGGGE